MIVEKYKMITNILTRSFNNELLQNKNVKSHHLCNVRYHIYGLGTPILFFKLVVIILSNELDVI